MVRNIGAVGIMGVSIFVFLEVRFVFMISMSGSITTSNINEIFTVYIANLKLEGNNPSPNHTLKVLYPSSKSGFIIN